MPCRPLVTAKTVRFVVVVAALVAFSSLGLRGAPQRTAGAPLLLISPDIRRAGRPRAQRVIVHGTDRELDLLASRHRLQRRQADARRRRGAREQRRTERSVA